MAGLAQAIHALVWFARRAWTVVPQGVRTTVGERAALAHELVDAEQDGERLDRNVGYDRQRRRQRHVYVGAVEVEAVAGPMTIAMITWI
jgi:hypothetical protein